jgi:hypothetical protein
MRATKAYIASAGTAAVMLAASVSLFGMVSAFVAFGGWPGTAGHTSVDQVVLDALRPKAEPVAVSRGAAASPRVTPAPATRRSAQRRGTSGGPAHRTAGTGTVQTAPAGGTLGVTNRDRGALPVSPADDPVERVGTTTRPLIQNAPPPVQGVANQVSQVIDQVGGTLSRPPPPPLQAGGAAVNRLLGG